MITECTCFERSLLLLKRVWFQMIYGSYHHVVFLNLCAPVNETSTLPHVFISLLHILFNLFFSAIVSQRNVTRAKERKVRKLFLPNKYVKVAQNCRFETCTVSLKPVCTPTAALYQLYLEKDSWTSVIMLKERLDPLSEVMIISEVVT